MALTDPFPAGVEAWLEDPLAHLYKVTVLPVSGAPFEVAVVGRLDVTYDMDWTPFVQVAMTVATPTDPAQLAALDSRLGTRVQVRMGYRHTGTDHWGSAITLRLHTAETPFPGMTTDLSLQGAEMTPLNRYAPVETDTSFDGYPDKTGVDAFIRSWIRRGYEPSGPYPPVVSTIPGGSWGLDVVSGWKSSGGTYWAAIDMAAKASSVRVYDDGTGTFRIDHLPALSGTYAASVTTGKRGTVTSADTSVDRERWFNRVTLQYDYIQPDGVTPSTIGATARVTTGPYAATATNTREYFRHYTVPWYVSQSNAQAVANHLLAKFMQRGREKSLTAAAAYWLRPGHTIRTRLGAGAAWEAALVSAVTFSPLTGSMAVRTTRPENYETGA